MYNFLFPDISQHIYECLVIVISLFNAHILIKKKKDTNTFSVPTSFQKMGVLWQ